MCQVLKVSSSSFYRWLTRPKSARDIKTEEISELIKEEFERSHRIYGSPRIAQSRDGKQHLV